VNISLTSSECQVPSLNPMANYKIIGSDRKEYGPVAGETLHQWIREGRLNGQSVAQSEGSSEWKTLAAFPEFSEDLRALSRGLSWQPDLQIWVADILSREMNVHAGQCLGLSW